VATAVGAATAAAQPAVAVIGGGGGGGGRDFSWRDLMCVACWLRVQGDAAARRETAAAAAGFLATHGASAPFVAAAVCLEGGARSWRTNHIR
jgi:hypothetical protein